MATKALVENLCRKYNTRNPFALADVLKIRVLFEPLGEIRGYYNRFLRQKWIHINNELGETEQAFTCAHEIGHALLHVDVSTPFLRKHTLFSVDKLEVAADRFAVLLLYSDYELQPYLTRSIYDMAKDMGIPAELAQYRMERVQPTLFCE